MASRANTVKSPAYGRHWIYQCVRIEEPIQKGIFLILYQVLCDRCQVSGVWCPVSGVTCHMPRVGCHLSPTAAAMDLPSVIFPSMQCRMLLVLLTKNKKSFFFCALIFDNFCEKITNSETNVPSLFFHKELFWLSAFVNGSNKIFKKISLYFDERLKL